MIFIRNLGMSGTGDATFAPGVWVNLVDAPYGAGGPILVTDFNSVGDADIIMQTAFGYTTLVDGSFLKSGYAPAQLVAIAARPPAGVQGDYNDDGVVDVADYILWRNNWGQSVVPPNDPTPGFVSTNDYSIWKANYGKMRGSAGSYSGEPVPEPPSSVLALTMLVMKLMWDRCGSWPIH
jgi:hypothetical protein